MRVVPSAIADVELHEANGERLESSLAAILKPALPFAVMIENRSKRGIAFWGMKFDLLGPRAKHYSVVHYADTLRNPGRGDFGPGTQRFVCAEPEYTRLALQGGDVQARAKMNLDNLRSMLTVTARLDCVAFDDGQFLGPDSEKAFERLAIERSAEEALIEEALSRVSEPQSTLEAWLGAALADQATRARRAVARQLMEALEAGGPGAMAARAREHRYRIALWR